MDVVRADSPLGSWVSARWFPAPGSPLHDFVQHVWYFDGRLANARERVFPDGSAELIVMLDEPHRDGDVEPLAAFPALCINGLRTRPSVVVAPGERCRVLGIRLHPVGGSALLRESMKHLLDVTIDLRDCLGVATAELGARCAHAADTSVWNSERNARAIVREAVAWLTERVSGATVDPAVRWTASVIRSTRGSIAVDDIASRLSMPRAQLARRFNDFTGVTPKRFARIVRFHNALTLIGRGVTIACAAAELGYYDQAHLYRDFVELARMTPGAFIAATRYPGGASLAEA